MTAPPTGESPVTEVHDGQDPDPIPDTTPKVGDVVQLARDVEPFPALQRLKVEAVEPDGRLRLAGVTRVTTVVDPQDVQSVTTQESSDE